MTFTLGINALTFGVGLIGVLFIYLLLTTIQATFVTFTPRSMVRFMMIMFLVGFLLPWIIIGETTMIILIGILIILFVILTTFRSHKSKSVSNGAISTSNKNNN